MVGCIHHWDLGAPGGELVHAKCRKCGVEKDFPSVSATKFSFAHAKKTTASHTTAPESKTPD
ncbi:hypothetical protein ACFLXE_07080 [Chloroflexota bacterium]